MARYLRHIDHIARIKQRDVLYLLFRDSSYSPELIKFHEYEDDPNRADAIQWLDSVGISWAPCFREADENSIRPYKGDIYLDVPFDLNDPDYQKLAEHFELPDESNRIKGVYFCYFPLQEAMKNAHHDEPGFWDQWAENF